MNKIKKLKHKSVSEICYRGYRVFADKIEEKLFDAKRYGNGATSQIHNPGRDHFLSPALRPRFFFHPERRKVKSLFKSHFSQALEEAIQRAEKLSRMEFNFLGKDVTYRNKIAWHRDPLSGSEYPLQFFRNLKVYSDATERDVKYVWEVNRHQYFIELSKTYFLTGEEKYCAQVIEWMRDWIEQNPYKMGVNWTSALEVAVRAYAWIWSFYFLLESPLIDDQFIEKFLNSLHLHGRYLNENLSFYSSPYNHLIGEASALFTIGFLFPEFPEAARWMKKGWKILVKELPRQFHSDGMGVEQATFYHYFTLGFFLMPVILRRQNSLTVPQEMVTMLEKILLFSLHLTRPDGTTPWIGDVDNARSIYFSRPESWDFRNFLAIGAVLLNSPELKFGASELFEDVLWLFGPEGVTRFNSIEPKQPDRKVKFFPQSGYLIGRTHWGKDAHYFLLDCGPISHGLFTDDTPSAAHGHADILSFELDIWGKPFVIDPGCHNYRGNMEWHTYFRSGAGHNCLLLDGKDMAKQGDILFWSEIATPQFMGLVVKEDLIYFRGSHTGFASLPGAPKHVRHFLLLNEDLWVVLDEVQGKGVHLIDSYLHLMPSKVFARSPEQVAIQREQTQVQVFFSGAPTEWNIKEGGAKVRDGWIAPFYGCAQPAPLIHFRATAQLPFLHYVVFIPGTPEVVKIERTAENFLECESSRAHYRIAIKTGPDIRLPAKDASMTCLLRADWNANDTTDTRRGYAIAETDQDLRLLQYEVSANNPARILADEKIEQ